MVEIVNWFLNFCKDMCLALVSIESVDGYSFGNMYVGISVVGVVILATIGAVAVVNNNIRKQGMAPEQLTHRHSAKEETPQHPGTFPPGQHNRTSDRFHCIQFAP